VFSKERDVAVTYRSIAPGDYDAIRQLLIEVGWVRRVANQSRFERMLKGATTAVIAVDGDRVVGFGRALTDGASNGYISTLAVAPDYQRQGIGRQIVARIMDLPVPPGHITWVLRSAPGSEAFWRKMGFAPSACAMERVRTE